MGVYEVIARCVGYGFWIVVFICVLLSIFGSNTSRELHNDGRWYIRKWGSKGTYAYPEDEEDPVIEGRRLAKRRAEEAARPYWCNLERFVQECHRRNTSRPTRGKSGFCYVCGRSHDHTTSDGNPKNGYRCTYCQNEIFQIVCQHNDLPDDEKRYIWLREDLERMVALDLSDGVITMEQAKEDYGHIDDLIAEKREFDAGADERERQRVAAIKQREQDVSDAIANSRRNISRRI